MTGRAKENSGSADANGPFNDPIDPLSETYRSGGVLFRKALTGDNERLKATLRDNAMDSWVRLSFEREPSYFDGVALMGKSCTVMACDENQFNSIVGMYSCEYLPVHVNGASDYVGYLGGLRVNRQYRHKVRILKSGFASIPHLAPVPGAAPFWFTSVASENTPARRLLEAGLKGMPVYRPLGVMETLAFNTRQGKLHGLLQQAVPGDIPAMVDFFNRQAARYQFSPVLTQEWLMALSGDKGLTLGDFWLAKDGADIRACLAIWDQRAFKQTVSRGYRFPLDAFRGAYNLYAGATGRVKLPAVGKKLEQVFLSFVAVDNPESTLSLQIVREGLAHAWEKGAEVGILGLSVENPLAAILKRTLTPSVYRTCIETVSLPDGLEPMLNGSPPQPEVAVL
jgi:hypothetical protein